MTKKILDINLDNKVKFDIFSQAEENLYIDMLIKTDEKMREKANEYAGYLEKLKMYLEFEDEKEVNKIIEFLKSKNEIKATKEEKREYMEMKFDVLDGKIEISKSSIKDEDNLYFSGDFYTLDNKNLSQLIEKFNIQLESYFPVIGNNKTFFLDYFKILHRNDDEHNKYDFFVGYEEIISNEEIENDNEYKYSLKNELKDLIINFNYSNPIIENINDFKEKKYVIIPFLIPKTIEWDKNTENPYIIKWEFKRLKIKSIKQNDESENNFNLFNKFIFLKEDLNYKYEYYFISKIFPKTNLYCDYRFFDRSFFK